MASYAIGDIQGCYQPLVSLLQLINFDPTEDQLWLAGDLINRGPETLQTLRFITQLDRQHNCISAVLGNHDLHFLAVAHGHKKSSRLDTLDELLNAPDRAELITWLRQRPLVHSDNKLGYTMVHAGIAPQWSIPESLALAREVEEVLKSAALDDFLAHMYGNKPDIWHDNLDSFDRWRCITNYFTRMRFCDANGRLDLTCKTGIGDTPEGLAPWFLQPNRAASNHKILFGHWAALEGQTGNAENVFALDTGCVWGGKLSALRLEDERLFQVEG